jgi:hypothetical protein
MMEDQSGSNGMEEMDVTVKKGDGSSEYNQFLVSPQSAHMPEHPWHDPGAEHAGSLQVCGALFECPAKYLPIKPIGKGAYGVVW